MAKALPATCTKQAPVAGVIALRSLMRYVVEDDKDDSRETNAIATNVELGSNCGSSGLPLTPAPTDKEGSVSGTGQGGTRKMKEWKT